MNRKNITAASLVGYFFVGFIPITLAPALPFLIREFDLTLAAAGAVFASRSAGSFLGVLLGGILSDYLGRKPIIIIGCLLQGLILGLIGISPSWLLITLLFGLVGLGVGLINSPINAIVAEVNAHRRGAALNALHGVYSVGAMVGPVAAAFILASVYGWRYIFFGGCLIWSIYGVGLLFVSFPTASVQARKKAIHQVKPSALLFNPILLILFFVSFIYNGTATSLVSWINTYLDQSDFPILLGAGMVSIFYLGLSLGRFACGYLSERLGYSKVIQLCAMGSLAFYPAAIYFSHPLLIALGVFFAGLFFSGLHPTGLAYANRLFPAIGGTISSILATSMAVGAMSIPWIIGIAADWIGFKSSFGISIVMLVILVIISFILTRLELSDSTMQVEKINS